ncbi:FecR domain-containing protein [Paraburkholderia sp. DHOC27]|uniref:FecR domain-containing protein n=1 Tax=Paraburkholderia sp. DHOC27 TaxID=2303330 RepID=UPI000E3B79CC|nr:FecR domain-containing protein [Paraburkholderia sp. DHOC27]RFU49905.1 LysM peptidoglycan-binding domain-containing protein [Paraburkholderia sp. DHOC27]
MPCQSRGLGSSRSLRSLRSLSPLHALIAALIVAPAATYAATATHPHHPATPQAVYVTYVTSQGDTLYEIAQRYLRNPHDWTVLSRLNGVPAPRHLQAGVTLRLPAALLRQDQQAAHVVAASGPVERAFDDGPFTPLAAGMTLGEGDRVRTGHEGFVTLELEDGTHVTVSQDATVVIGTLRVTALTGATDRVIQLHQGEVDSEVTHATKKDDRFQIRSPSVVAGVRGTRFRVDYDGGAQRTAVEVLDGAVGVDPASIAAPPPGVPLRDSQQLVAAHFGNVSDAGGAVGVPVALLPAPALLEPGKVQDGKTVAFDLVAQAQAVGYRVQIARDADLLDLIRDQRVSEPHADFGDLADGTYFVRIAALGHDGLEGLPQTYAFERRQLGLAASAEARPGSRDYTFRWFVSRAGVATRFRFVLGTTADLGTPLVDRTDLPAGEIVVTDLPRGVYYWTVIAEQFENGRFYEKSSSIRSFTLAR